MVTIGVAIFDVDGRLDTWIRSNHQDCKIGVAQLQIYPRLCVISRNSMSYVKVILLSKTLFVSNRVQIKFWQRLLDYFDGVPGFASENSATTICLENDCE